MGVRRLAFQVSRKQPLLSVATVSFRSRALERDAVYSLARLDRVYLVGGWWKAASARSGR
jgi:hypothetical protein